jgi:hypothetical protein
VTEPRTIPPAGAWRPAPSCCLFLAGDSAASAGLYSPLAYWIEPRGGDLAEHHVLHLHEIHHKVLNDDTSWGSFIHIAARHPGWDEMLLPSLVASCRTVHESFASYMSLSLAQTRHGDANEVLDRYPIYRALAHRMGRLVDHVDGRQRREMAATAVARWCMSGPVIELALAAYPQVTSLNQIPSSMRPDHRFRLLGMLSASQVLHAATTADMAFETSHGRPLEALSLSDNDAELDSAWAAWESEFIATLVASSDRLAQLPTVEPDGHLADAAALVRVAGARGITLALPHEPDMYTLTDVESVQRLLTSTTLVLRDTPFRAALAVPGEEVGLEGVLDLCAAQPTPNLVVHARRTTTLVRTFRFPMADSARLATLAPGPVFAIRSLIDGDGEDLILNTEIVEPLALSTVDQAWASRGTRAVVIAASCYLNLDWQRTWLPALRAWPTVVLVDMGLATMVGEGHLLGSVEDVHGTYLGLGRPDLKALVWHVDGHPHVMLAVGDDLTIQLFAGQLDDLLGERLSLDDSDWSQWLDVLAAAASSVIGTEPDLRYGGDGV